MSDINVETPNGSIDAVLEVPSGEEPSPGVVVIHDAFGLREPHREIARRIADNGYLALAPNLFARGGMIRCMQAVFNAMRRAIGWYPTRDRLRCGDPITMAADALAAYQADTAAGKEALLLCDTAEMVDALNDGLTTTPSPPTHPPSLAHADSASR